MSLTISKKYRTHFIQYGWYIISNAIPDVEDIAASVIQETLFCTFTSDEEKKVVKKLIKKDINPLNLLTDTALRQKYFTNPNCVWYNNNSRTPKVAKNNGLVNIYHNNLVRDKVLFNKDIYTAISTLYSLLHLQDGEDSEEEDLVFLYGPDRVCVKSQHSTNMPYHIDCDLTCSLPPSLTSSGKKRTSKMSAASHPLYMQRIQSVACLQIDASAKYNGRTEVLSGYNSYFILGAKFFTPYFTDLDSAHIKIGREFAPIVVQKVFSDHLEEFNTYINTFYTKSGKLSFSRTSLSKEEDEEEALRIYDSLPNTRIPVQWIAPPIQAGDIFCFNQRLPHRNTRNDSSIPRVACFISLYPQSQLSRKDCILSLFTGTDETKTRATYNNILERIYFKDIWQERTTIKKTKHIRKVLAITSKVEVIVKNKKSSQKKKDID